MKRILSIMLLVCLCLTAVLPMTAFAADMETAIGTSGDIPATLEDTDTAAVASPTEAAEQPDVLSEATPGDTSGGDVTVSTEEPEDTSGGNATAPTEAPEETTVTSESDEFCDMTVTTFSEFTGDENEFFTRIRLTVTDRQGNPLPGAVYGLYTSNGDLVEMLTTGANGEAVSGDVPVDIIYYLEEISPPTGFSPNTGRRDVNLAEVCAPSLVSVTVEYDQITGRIEVVKTDDEGYPLYGAGFYVYNADTGELVDDITTGQDGTATTIELPYGRYELYEYQAPWGFDGGGYYMAMIEEDGLTVEVHITNNRVAAYLCVHKTGEDGRPIQGAVFSVYDINYGWWGDITTDANGYAYSDPLPLNGYFFVEKSVPDGYRLDETQHDFFLDTAWQTVTFDIVNERDGDPGKVRVVKTDDSGNPLSGIVFGLYRAWDGLKLGELTTGEDGVAESDPLIPQDYYLVELQGKDGYDMATGQIPFTIDRTGATASVIVVNAKSCVFGKARVVKSDDGEPLAGVRFGLYCDRNNLLEELVTGADGTATSGVLNEGDYYLVELAGLPGYIPDSQRYPFTISENNVIVPVAVENDRIRGSVRVIKSGDSGEPLPGVVFGVYQDDAQLAELTTGEDGTATSDVLFYGAYELRELSTVPGYELLAAPIPFSILEEGVTIDIPVSNPLILGGVRVWKCDEAQTPLPGAVFGLYNGQEQLIAELTTGEDGFSEYTGLPVNSYFLREHSAPDGFIASEEDIPFTISAQGEVFETAVVNVAGRGALRVYKLGDPGEDQPNGVPLAGVVFGVYRTSGDEKVGEIVTDENGQAEIELPLGAYYLLEKQTAEGYKLPDGGFSFTLTEHGAVYDMTILNQLAPEEYGAVRLIKLAGGTDAPLPGALFGLYDAAGTLVTTLTTGEDGAANCELPAGDYYTIEEQAPEGFRLDDTPVSFTVTTGETTELTIYNTALPPAPGFIRVTKKADGTDALLPGAVFGVYRLDGDEKIAELTTGEDGTVISGELPAADYYLRELKAPASYKLTEDKFTVTVVSGETAELEIVNALLPPEAAYVKLIKLAEGTREPLVGAVFGVYTADGDVKLAEITTDKNGEALYELPPNDYYLRELSAPKGFVLSAGKVGFTVAAGGTKTVTVLNTPEKPADGYVRVTKLREDTDKPLRDAVFGVYRSGTDEKVDTLTTGRDGTATSNPLPAGDYYLLELKAPRDMKLGADKIGFTIKSGQTKELTVYNTPKEEDAPDAGTLRLLKKAEGSGERLSGAVFGVYRLSDNKKLTEITTGKDGEAILELEPGSFYLRELKAPSGFLAETSKIPFTIQTDATVLVEVTNMRDLPGGGVKLIKRGPEGEAVAGAVFGVYKAAGSVKVGEITTNKEGTAFLELPAGAYYLLEKNAPAEYALSTEKYSFTVSSGQTVEVRVVNQRAVPPPTPAPATPTPDPAPGGVTIPKTGEVFPVMNYLLSALFFAAAALCGCMLIRGRKMKAA